MTKLMVNKREFRIPDETIDKFIDSIEIVEALAAKSKLKNDYLKAFKDVDNFKDSMADLLELSKEKRATLDYAVVSEDEMCAIINSLYFERKNEKINKRIDVETLIEKLEMLL